MSLLNPKLYTGILQLSIIGLTWALVWFAFVYYPKVINDYKTGKVPTQSVLKPVSATSKKFPIETPAYRITYEENSHTYYVFVQGSNLEEYVFNRDNSKLALKSALSVENLCGVNVFFVPVQELKIPKNFNQTSC